MKNLTARVQVSLPVDVKSRLAERAKQRGLSLSALMREITDDLIAGHDLSAAIAEIGKQEVVLR